MAQNSRICGLRMAWALKRDSYEVVCQGNCFLFLYYRKRDAVDLLVDIEGVDISHATNVVDDGHEARFEVRCIDIVLARHTTD